MSNPINDGGAAFPVPQKLSGYIDDGANGCEFVPYRGMTLRDWFAGKALAGILANSNREGTPKEYAHDAYEQADAMLAARNEVKP